MLAGRRVVQPNVARHRRRMVFAPFILEAFPVLIKKSLSVGRERYHFGRRAKHLLRSSPANWHTVQFRHRRCWEKRTGSRILNACRKIDIRAVGRNCAWRFRSRIKRKTRCGPAACRHHKHVGIAITIARKCNLFPIGRPHRRRLVRIVRRQPHSLAAIRRNSVNISLIAKCHLRPVGGNPHVAHPQRLLCRSCHRHTAQSDAE